MSSSTTTQPRPIRERQVRIERTAPRAQLRGRKEASNLDAALEAPRGFVLNLTQKLAEGCVQDRPGELGFRHPLRVQVLDADAIVLPRQLGCQLVKKVASLAGHFTMYPSHSMLGFLSAAAARLLSREVLLSFPELPVGSPGEPGSRNTSTVREDEQVFESKVYTNRVLRRGRLYIGHLELSCQANVPVSCRVSLERHALGLSFDLSGLADTNPTYLRHVDPAALDFDPLGDSESEVPGFLGAELGKAAAFFEERIESPVHVSESLLKHLRVGLSEPERLRFALLERGQLRGKLFGRDALAVFGVVALAPCERPVVDEPARPGHLVQTGLLSLRRAHPEPVDLAQLHVLGPRALGFDVLLNRRFRDAARRGCEVRRGPHRGHLPKMRKVLAKNPRCVALEPVDELTNRKRRRSVDEHMQVVGLDREMLNANLKLLCFLAE
jgi:hypothetical protein